MCFNLVTLCGQAAKIDPRDFAKCGMSMYQAFAAVVGLAIAIEMAFEELVETWKPMLPMLTKSLFASRTTAANR